MADNKKNSKQIERRKRGVVRAKSEFFRTARYGLTLQEHRIIYYAILKGQQDGTPFEPVVVSIQEFLELCEIKGTSAYTTVRKLSQKLLTKVVEVVYKNDAGEHLLQAQWLSAVKYHTKEGNVTITPNKELQPFFEGKPFSDTEFYFLIKFTSQYAERLYEILKSLNHKKIINMDIEDLRTRLWIKENQYSNYADFKRRVLEPAIQDINEFTDIDVTFREKRGQYNRVETIYFAITQKKIPKLADRIQTREFVPPLSEKESKKLMKSLLGDDVVVEFEEQKKLGVDENKNNKADS